MTEKVLLFFRENYDLFELQELSDSEKYELAQMGKMLDDDADILSLYEYRRIMNSEKVNNCWKFLVSV